MSEDSKEHWLVTALAGANLPQLLLGPAGKAISQLIAGAADIPTAWLTGKADDIRADTEARRRIKIAMADAAGDLALEDSGLVDRALQSYLPQQMRKQSNREGVARATLEYLDSDEPPAPEEPPADIDPDWMNVFVRYAEDASSERLQELWGRVLAGEIRGQGQTSLSTLRFISELDPEVASQFEKFAPRVVQSTFARKPERLGGTELSSLRLLEEMGLLTGIQGNFDQKVTFDHEGFHTIWSKRYFLRLKATPGFEYKIRAMLLTRVGREVYKLLDQPEEIASLRDFAQTSRKPEIVQANIYDRKIVNGLHMRVEPLWNDEV